MSRLPRVREAWPALLALAVAEAGARLLAPRRPALTPAPVDAERYFSSREIERGARFARPQLALGLGGAAGELCALAGLVVVIEARRGRSPRRRPRARRPVARGAIAGASMALGSTLVTLPLGVLGRRRAIAVGLVTQPWRGWAADLLKSTAIETGLAGAGGGAVVALTRRYPRGWWLPAAVGASAVGTLFGALAPVVLAPLFNDFAPLPDGQTRADVLELARAAGVGVGEVYSVDASRRTTGANAYVTGLGPTKRVVLFDTLLDRYSRDEVRVVVAHELAHVRNRDVLRGVLYAAIVAGPVALAVQRLSWALSVQRGTAEALPALALAVALVSAPLGLIANRMSRAMERRADEFSLQLSGAPDAFVSFERAITIQNVADVQPPRWVTAVLASHPPTLERIAAAAAYSSR
ncbi:MAG TPA: M48 family metalloprotease [Solirubrobacteraceae bacterium]|nr:M48 family metalloprotease [Solirubrobacteraceae bacterium]